MIHDDFYGDKFRWFVGVVKDTYDDKNRVRVRIFGIHHTDDVDNVSDGDLPAALVLYPTTGAQSTGGSLSHGLKHGTWVFGFFADGDDCQQPVIVGVIDGGVGAVNDIRNSGRATPGTFGDGYNAGTEDGPTSNETINIPGGSNIEKAYNFLREKIEKSGQSSGNIHDQVCGVIGNLMEESNVNPNGPRGDRGTAYGIAQWRLDRREKLKRMYGEPSNLEQQLSFLWHELQTTEKKAFYRLMAAKNVFEATIAFCYFERPRCYKITYIDTNDSTFPGRLKKAHQVKNSINYTPPGVS